MDIPGQGTDGEIVHSQGQDSVYEYKDADKWFKSWSAYHRVWNLSKKHVNL